MSRDACVVCGEEPKVERFHGMSICHLTGWMRVLYPVPPEQNGVMQEIANYCPKCGARAAGLLKELQRGNVP